MNMPSLNIHTYCQVAHADPLTETCQKVWLFLRTEKRIKKKHGHTTKAIRNLGKVLILMFLALNKISRKLKINSLKIPNYA